MEQVSLLARLPAPFRLRVIGPADGWHVLDLQRAANESDLPIELTSMSFEQIAASVANKCSHADGFDGVFVRAMQAGSLEQIVFRMDALQRLANRGIQVVNSPKAMEASIDKYLSLALIEAAGVKVPKTRVSQTVDQAMVDFRDFNCKVVVKPLFGSLGKGVRLLESENDAIEYFTAGVAQQKVIYQQAWIDHGGEDLRLFFVGDDRVFAMKRVRKQSLVTNLYQGGTGIPHQATEEEITIGLKAMQAVGAQIGGVDLVRPQGSPNRDAETSPYVLEVNAAPGWRGIQEVLKIDMAIEILRWFARSYVAEP